MKVYLFLDSTCKDSNQRSCGLESTVSLSIRNRAVFSQYDNLDQKNTVKIEENNAELARRFIKQCINGSSHAYKKSRGHESHKSRSYSRFTSGAMFF